LSKSARLGEDGGGRGAKNKKKTQTPTKGTGAVDVGHFRMYTTSRGIISRKGKGDLEEEGDDSSLERKELHKKFFRPFCWARLQEEHSALSVPERKNKSFDSGGKNLQVELDRTGLDGKGGVGFENAGRWRGR